MPIPNAIRYFNKRFTNRFMMLFAGKRYSPIALLQHTGRTSGNIYHTPVVVRRVGDVFFFALTYGSQVDWYRNVLAAQEAVLIWRAERYTLVHPESVDKITYFEHASPIIRHLLKRAQVEDYFRMHIQTG